MYSSVITVYSLVPSLQNQQTMENDDPILHDFSPLFIQHKSGRIHRLAGTAISPPPHTDPATGVSSKSSIITTNPFISACLYLPPNLPPSSGTPLLIYFHGGGFCIQSAFSPTYHPHLTALSARANLLIVSVDYRLAPEHPLPAAYDDCWAALKWTFSRADPWVAECGDLGRVFLAGDSAGANIAHRMAVRAGEEGVREIEGMVLVHPYFWGLEAIEGDIRDEGFREWMEGLWRVVSGGKEKGLEDECIDPGKEEERRVVGMACRRVMVCVAEGDPMRARGRAYWEMLRKVKEWEVEIVETKEEGHVFHLDGREEDDGKVEELVAAMVGFFLRN